MKRKTIILMMAAITAFSLPSQAFTSQGTPVESYQWTPLCLQASIDLSKGNILHPKAPVLMPCVYQDDHYLNLVSGCENAQVLILDKYGVEVFSIDIVEGCTFVQLPDYLSGEYELHIHRGNFCFWGTIEL